LFSGPLAPQKDFITQKDFVTLKNESGTKVFLKDCMKNTFEIP
jgi:hypothetical protein